MKVLLHICCAPCAVYPLSTVALNSHEVAGYFYNPNIHPHAEYARRRAALEVFAAGHGMRVFYAPGYPEEDFLRLVADKEPKERCSLCYRLRMEQTAIFADSNGFSGISTTLLYSRHQRHDLIRETGEAAAARHGLEFLYADFRRGWQEGSREAKRLGLYRQKYCGCVYSERERSRQERRRDQTSA